jgi:hypothetical protein
MSHTFFGLQIAITPFRQDSFRSRLHDLIGAEPAEQSLQMKRTFWKKAVALINGQMPVFELGFWDLIRGEKAEGEFETWTSEIEAGLATEPEELGTAPDEVNRLSADKSYVLVTCLVLVPHDSNSDSTLGERCDVPERDWWTRQTLARLVASFPLLNFGEVLSDAIYLSPGSQRDGLSMEDLHGGGYEYLKPLG